MKKIIIALLIVTVVFGVYYLNKNTKKPSQNSLAVVQKQENLPQPETQKPTSTPPTVVERTSPAKNNKPVKTYTMEEVVKHGSDPNNYVDCWTVIQDRVYNITQYADSLKHPGGEQIYQACGADATAMFETRPTGSKTPHSSEARKILEKYYIGDLKK
jgi:cytochrome b involved in lipid metabolism